MYQILASRRERAIGAVRNGGRPRRYFKLSARGVQVAMEHRAIVSEVFGLVPEGSVTRVAPPDTSATTFWVLVHAIQQIMTGSGKGPKKET